VTSSLDEKVADAITQQAAEWWLMQREGAMKGTAREAFLEWLRRSPEHIGAYFAVASAAKDLQAGARSWPTNTDDLLADAAATSDSVANVVAFPAEHYAQARAAGSSRARRSLIAVAVAATIVLIAVVGAFMLWDGQRFGLPRAYETAHAEQGSWPLPDGSVLHLNSDSRAVVRYGDSERLITVERGQAMFQVTKDPTRRFRVNAGPVQVVALGTEFDVYRKASETRVVVLEGRVAVLRDGPVPGPATLAIPGATALSAGEQIDVGPAKPTPARPADMRRTRAWLQRQIVFSDLPLAEVVEDFNRYTKVPFEIESQELKALRITGVFGAYDVDSFLVFLRRLDGVQVEAGPSKIRIYLERQEPTRAPPSVRSETEAAATVASLTSLN
jgi:transmembrane sensor